MKAKKEKPKTEKVKMSKRRKIVYSAISAVMLGGGVAAGIFLANYFTFTEVEYGTIEYAKSIEDNVEDIMKRYNAKPRSANELINDFKTYELVDIAHYKLENLPSYHLMGKGEVVAEVTQDIHSTLIKNGDNYFAEQLSGGLISVAKRVTQSGTTAQVYEGSLSKDTSKASWNSSPTKEYPDLATMEEEWGRDLSRSGTIIVCEKTVKPETSKAEIVDGNIVVTVDLDVTDAVIRYVRQMKVVSELSSYPTFRAFTLKLTMNPEMTLLERSSHEEYTVNKIGNHDSVQTLVEKFSYEENPHIPSMSEDCVYE